MNNEPATTGAADRSRLARQAVVLIVLASLALTAGRIVSVENDTKDAPFLSANDRSRWCTIRALVDEGGYEIDRIIQLRHARTHRRHWQTIDMVRHRGRDGQWHYYSSKPPLLPTLLAGQYWLIKHGFGLRFGAHTFYIVRLMLLANNLVPLAIYFWMLVRLADRYGATDWGRLFLAAAAAWATPLTTFAVTLNNHLPAAVCVLGALYLALPIWLAGRGAWIRAAAVGLLAGLAAANELPALSFTALLGAALMWRAPKLTAAGFVPGAALVAAAFLLTNYAAHGDWRPPYAHRSDGPIRAVLPRRLAAELASGPASGPLREALAAEGIRVTADAAIRVRSEPNSWELQDPATGDRWALALSDQGLEVRQWDNWYDYEGSYWRLAAKRGVDRGEPSRLVYAFHVLAGHHGLLSLTPIWLLSIIGGLLAFQRRDRALRFMVLLTAVLTAVCLAFYLSRPLADRNYGGVSCCFRWMLWFTPLWLLCLLPAADQAAGRRAGRVLALALLAASVFSASYCLADPWRHPWLYDYWTSLGWIRY